MDELPRTAAAQGRLLEGKDWVWIGMLLLVGGGLRFGALNRESFWEDELAQLGFVLGPFEEIPTKAGSHQQPGLDYLLEGLVVRVAGTSAAARLPAALLGTLSLAVLYVVFRGVARRGVCMSASGLMLLCTSHLHYSREARPYMHSLFWVGLFWLGLLRARRVNRLGAWTLAAGVGLVMLNVRGFDPAMLLLACMCWGLAEVVVGRWRGRDRLRGLVGGVGFRGVLFCGAALLAFGPQAYRIMWNSRTLGYRWPSWGRPAWADESVGFYLESMVSGLGGLLPAVCWSFAALGLVLFTAWMRAAWARPEGSHPASFAFNREAALFVTVHVLALCGYVAAYRLLNRGIMNPPKTGYFLFLLPGASLVTAVGMQFVFRMAAGVISWGGDRRRAATAAAVSLAIVAAGVDSLVGNGYLTGRLRPDWRGMLKLIDSLGRDGDLVFRETAEPFGAYEYHPVGGRGVLHEKDFVVTNTASLSRVLAERKDWSGRVFLIYSGGGYRPEADRYPAGTKVRGFHGGEVIYYDPPRGFLEEVDGLVGWLAGLGHPGDPALADVHLARAVIAEHQGRRSLYRLRVAMARALAPEGQEKFFEFVRSRIEASLPALGHATAREGDHQADKTSS